MDDSFIDKSPIADGSRTTSHHNEPYEPPNGSLSDNIAISMNDVTLEWASPAVTVPEDKKKNKKEDKKEKAEEIKSVRSTAEPGSGLPALQNITLEIEKGQMVAVVGTVCRFNFYFQSLINTKYFRLAVANPLFSLLF